MNGFCITCEAATIHQACAKKYACTVIMYSVIIHTSSSIGALSLLPDQVPLIAAA